MDNIFMNSGNRKTPDSHRLLLNLSDKINLLEIQTITIYWFYLVQNYVDMPTKSNNLLFTPLYVYKLQITS